MSALKKICFVLTTPFAANAFLLGHLRALADHYHVSLCVNCHSYPLSPLLDSRVQVINIGIERKISPVHDLRSLWTLICLFRRMRFDAVHSMTPKAGLLAMLASWIVRVPHRYHTFTGQVWANKRGGARFFFKLIDRLIVSIASRVFVDSPISMPLFSRRRCRRAPWDLCAWGGFHLRSRSDAFSARRCYTRQKAFGAESR